MPEATEATFRDQVQAIVRRIPHGRLMTYGQIAALLGAPRKAQAVGFVAHYGDPELPWQRVVNRFGRMAPGYPGGVIAHADWLRQEGVEVGEDFICDLKRYQWWPPESKV